MKPLSRLGDRERAVIEDRRATGYAVDALEHFGGRLEDVLRALLETLLPGVRPGIDLVSFVDSYAGEPLGRGDRKSDLPSRLELFTTGLKALSTAGFAKLSQDDRNELVARMRAGRADKELGMPAKDFVDGILELALAGYLAHPDTWERIGFSGPAYPEGYSWIGTGEAAARHRKAAGWESL